MRILLMTTNDWNGPVRLRHHNIFEILSSRHQIHVIRLALSSAKQTGRINNKNIVVHEPYTFRSSDLLSFYLSNYTFHFSKSLEVMKRERVDIVVVSNLISGIATISAAKLAGVPIVFDLLDYFPSFIRQVPSLPRSIVPFGEKIAGHLLECNLRLSDGIIVTSTVLRDLFRNRYSSKIYYVPNGVDTTRFIPSMSSSVIRKTGTVVIGFVGHLDFWVDTDIIIEAVEILARVIGNVKCLVVGGGPRLQEFNLAIRKRHLEQHFVLVGIVPYEQVPHYIAAMDVCLIPFKKTLVSHAACPNKLFEYLACGKPVVSTKIAEVARIAADIPLFAEDGREFAERIIEVISNESLRKSLGERGRTFALKYDWTNIASKYEAVLKHVLNSSR